MEKGGEGNEEKGEGKVWEGEVESGGAERCAPFIRPHSTVLSTAFDPGGEHRKGLAKVIKEKLKTLRRFLATQTSAPIYMGERPPADLRFMSITQVLR